MTVDAAQIASPQCHAMPIKKFEYLDGDFAAVIEPVSKRCSGELPVGRFGGDISRNLRHFEHSIVEKEVIRSDFINFAQTAEQLAEPARVTLRPADHCADVAHAGRTKTLVTSEQRSDSTP